MYNPEELKLEQGNQFAEVGIPGLNASAAAVRAREEPGPDDGTVLRHVRVRRGRPRPHRTDRRTARHAAADARPAGAAVLPRPGPVPLRAHRRRASGSPCSTGTAHRCGRRCRCACRSTSMSTWRPGKGCSSDRRPPPRWSTRWCRRPSRRRYSARRPPLPPPRCTWRSRTTPSAASPAPTWATPARWREIARANRIVDPFALVTGASLIIPTAAAGRGGPGRTP